MKHKRRIISGDQRCHNGSICIAFPSLNRTREFGLKLLTKYFFRFCEEIASSLPPISDELVQISTNQNRGGKQREKDAMELRQRKVWSLQKYSLYPLNRVCAVVNKFVNQNKTETNKTETNKTENKEE